MAEVLVRPVDARATWLQVRRFMETHCGVVMTDDQQYLLEQRLGPVARRFDSTIDEVVARACSSGGSPTNAHAAAVIDAMTTHETLFFRDPSFWRVLQEKILPELIASMPVPRLRIWSAACSTGQEPYSVAMLLEEHFPRIAPMVEIIASDISEAVLEQGRAGIYSSLEVNRGLGGARIVRHFERYQGGFRVKESLRSRISWRQANLLGASALPRNCHIVLCRNVLIYFGERERQIALRRIHDATVAHGMIGVGATEILPGRSISAGWYTRTVRSS